MHNFYRNQFHSSPVRDRTVTKNTHFLFTCFSAVIHSINCPQTFHSVENLNDSITEMHQFFIFTFFLFPLLSKCMELKTSFVILKEGFVCVDENFSQFFVPNAFVGISATYFIYFGKLITTSAIWLCRQINKEICQNLEMNLFVSLGLPKR